MRWTAALVLLAACGQPDLGPALPFDGDGYAIGPLGAKEARVVRFLARSGCAFQEVLIEEIVQSEAGTQKIQREEVDRILDRLERAGDGYRDGRFFVLTGGACR